MLWPLAPFERRAIIFELSFLLFGVSLNFLLKNRRFHYIYSNGYSFSEARPANRVYLNSASADDLIKVKGIGSVLAGRIVEYREAHGDFKRVEDLLNIKGIGPKKLDAIKQSLTVD